MSDTINDTDKAYIAGIGMITSVGADTDMTAIGIAAEYSGYRISDYHTQEGQPVTMSNVPAELFSWVEADINPGNRYREQYDHIIKMAIVALREALSQQPLLQQSLAQQSPIPLVLALPEPRPGVKHIDPNMFIANLAAQDDLPLSRERVHRLYTGRAAGIQGLGIALRYLYEAGEDYVLLGGSDSYLHYPRLHDLSARQRLLAPGVVDGFAPGEGAGFLLLTRHPHHALNQNDQIIALHPPGISEEPGHLHDNSDQPYRGDGLDQAFKGALAGALADNHGNNIHTVYSSMNGEHYWAKECSVAILRNQAHLQEKITIAHPADCYGDLGAATGSVLMGLAAYHLLKEHPGPTRHLVYGAADGPLRAAVRVEKIPQNIP
ncbi:MAG: hypothetical protein COB33_004875 [Thiotrichaceae bacterium]|nr:hypothetical protein [Thiotrichaceae bacterium]